jgi:membrane protease YdiL (CAAX protease family)
LGIAASPGALEVLTRTVQEKSIVIASAIWVTLAVGALAVARSHYTDLEIDLLKLSLRIPDARMRSVLDVLLLGILGPIVVEVLEGSERLGKFYQRAVAAGCGLSLAVFVWWIKGPPNSHLVLWATTYYEPGTRFLVGYDLCNQAWIGAILPILVVRETADSRVVALLGNTIGNSSSWKPIALVSAIPAILAVLLLTLMPGDAGAIDTLRPVDWGRKALTMLIWTGAPEEMTFRVAIYAACYASIDRLARESRRVWTAVALTAIIFALLHLNNGVQPALYAGCVSLMLSIVLVRLRCLDWCIIGHVAANLLLVRWNPH